MGCTLEKQEGPDPIPSFNLVVLGLEGVGKTTIVNQLKGEGSECRKEQLQIDSFVINKECKVIVFEVAGKAYKTWHNYLPICDIVMFVIDLSNKEQNERIPSLLQIIDKQLNNNGKIVLVFNKIDIIKKEIEEEDLKMGAYNLENVSHDIVTCKCSGKDKRGVLDLMKKVYSICSSFHKDKVEM